MDKRDVSEPEKYKAKIRMLVQDRGLYSVMNSTKWKELKKGVSELPFEPPFVIKGVDEQETDYHRFDDDSYYSSDWGLYLDNYLGGDIYAVPFHAVEWIKVRPRLLQHQGKLIEDKVIDETKEFLAILEKYNIPYEEQKGAYVIYGYID